MHLEIFFVKDALLLKEVAHSRHKINQIYTFITKNLTSLVKTRKNAFKAFGCELNVAGTTDFGS